MERRSLVASVIATVLIAPLLTAPAWAGIQPEPFRTGLFGVTAGQSIRISILNAGDAGGVINPCFHVWDAAGVLLLEVDGGPLPGGRGTFVDFTPIPSGALTRAQIRAEVVFEHGDLSRDATDSRDAAATRLTLAGNILVTLEVFDTATGQTAYTTRFTAVAGIEPQPFATVAGVEPEPFVPVAGIEPTPFTPRYVAVAGVDPQPFKTGLFGIANGQSIRVSAVNAGEAGGIIQPCMRVLDLEAALLFEADGEPLAAGGGAFVDFDLPPDSTRAPGFRAQVRVEVELVPAVHPPDVAPGPAVHQTEIHLSLEVYDTATGRTVYTMPFNAVGFNPQPEPPEPGQR